MEIILKPFMQMFAVASFSDVTGLLVHKRIAAAANDSKISARSITWLSFIFQISKIFEITKGRGEEGKKLIIISKYIEEKTFDFQGVKVLF